MPTRSCWRTSPTGACATRRWSPAIRPTACCSTSAAARIFTAASTRWSPIWASGIEQAGFAYSIAIAGTIGAAWAAAHFGEPASYAGGEERALLAPLPLAALRLAPDTVAALARVGLKRIGDIVDLPRSPLTARFGADLLRQLDRALGHEHEPLNPRLPVAPYVAEQRFAEPIAREQDVLAIVARLAARLQFALERRGDGARRIELTLFRTDGEVRRIAAGTSRPLRDPAHIRALFVERLAALADAFDPGFGFDMARLSVVVAEPAPPEQIGIGGGEDAAEIDRLVDRLSARLGAPPRAPADRAGQPYPRDRRRERAGAGGGSRGRSRLAGVSSFPRRGRPQPAAAAAADAAGADRSGGGSAGRPAVALPLAARAARGDRRRRPRAHRGRLVERAWRRSFAKFGADYFRVEDKSGLRFWLFRAGLYRDLMREDLAQGAAAPTWFLHGTFA